MISKRENDFVTIIMDKILDIQPIFFIYEAFFDKNSFINVFICHVCYLLYFFSKAKLRIIHVVPDNICSSRFMTYNT